MNKKPFYLLLISFFLTTPLYAQEELEENPLPQDKTIFQEHNAAYTGSFGNKFALCLSAYKSNLNLKQIYDNTEESYKSNRPLEIGFGFLYGNFGIEFNQQTSLLYNSNYKKTETRELRLNYYSKNIVLEIQKKDYKGFHTESNEETDLKMQSTGISGQYIWNNEKYSWRAAFGLYEKQFRSAGSFLLGGNAFYIKTKSQLPDAYEKKYILATPNIGYAYTWVYDGNLFLALSLSLGPGIASESNDGKNYLSVSHSFHGAAGYHWDDVSFLIAYQTFVFDIFLNKKDSSEKKNSLKNKDSFGSSLLQCTVAKRF